MSKHPLVVGLSLLSFVTAAVAFAESAPQASTPAPVVKLPGYIVEEKAGDAAATFSQKQLAEAIAERLTNAALERPTAENAGDLVKGAAGVSVSSDGDGGSKIAIRGMDTRFNRVTIDGQRQGGSQALESLPPEIVKSLEITKALTPDMDADAIGGAINVTTGDAADLKSAYVRGRHQVSVNTSTHRPGWRTNVTLGRPLRLATTATDRPDAGFLLGVNYDDSFRWRENIETNGDWPALLFGGRLIPAYTQARIETTHDEAVKKGAWLNADWRIGEGATLYLRSNYNSEARRRNRNRTFFDVAEGVPLALTPETGDFSGVRLEQRSTVGERERELLTVALGGKLERGRRTVEGHVGYARSSENEPALDANFASDGTFRIGYDTRPDPYRLAFSIADETTPSSPSARTDPARYHFDQLVDSRMGGREEELSAQLDLRWDLNDAPRPAYVKFGGKVQSRRRSTRALLRQYDAGATPLALAGFVGHGATALKTNGEIVGPTPDAARLAAETNGLAFDPTASQLESASDTYASTEDVGAVYGMGRIGTGPLSLIGGARVEATRYTAEGNQLVALDANDVALTPARAAGRYVQVLPGAHLRYTPRPHLLLRASVTRTLVRPDYRELAPRQSVSLIDRRIASGNPSLRPYEAMNYDLSLDAYLERAGLLTLAVFRKDIAHFIVETKRLVSWQGRSDFTESRSLNGDTARLRGIEAGWQSPAWAGLLPGARVSFEVNGTWSRSEAALPDRPGEALPLPEQAQRQINAFLRAERGAVSFELAGRYRSAVLEDVVAAGRDVYQEGRLELDCTLTWKPTKNVSLMAGVVNLTHRPIRIYSGDTRHQKEFEAAISALSVGVQWKH